MGSFFYIAFDLNQVNFANDEELWAVVSFIVLASIFIHGISATTVIKSLSGKYTHIEELIEKEEKE